MKRLSVHKITVIGGSGFIGTNLCQQLHNRGIDFEIIDIKPSLRFPKNFKYGDIRQYDTLVSQITGNTIIHLAAIHRDDVANTKEYYKTNVLGTENIIKVSKIKNINDIIFTSSVAVYGFTGPNTNESTHPIPFNDYGKSKLEAEKKLLEWNSSLKKSLTIIRPTVVFGKGNRGNVYNLFNQIYSKKFLMIGSGKNKKSLAYVENIVAFFLFIIEKRLPGNSIYNYADKPDYSMNTLVKIIQSYLIKENSSKLYIPYLIGLIFGHLIDLISFVSRKKFSISAVRIKKFCANSTFSSQKISDAGFLAPIKIDDAIIITLEYEFKNNNQNAEIFFTE
jgi:nucleoside-diphosphate-sugar epimerase